MIAVLSGCAVVTMDPGRTEYRSGYLAVDGSRIVVERDRLVTVDEASVTQQVVAACNKLASRAVR
jgi:hypothetical protein